MRPRSTIAVLLALAPAAPTRGDVTEAIFEIHATLRGRDYLSPWNPGSAWTVEAPGSWWPRDASSRTRTW